MNVNYNIGVFIYIIIKECLFILFTSLYIVLLNNCEWALIYYDSNRIIDAVHGKHGV